MALFTTPSHRTFFSLLKEAGANVEQATAELDRLMRGWPDQPDLRGELKRLEDEGDRITRDILHQLYTTSFTPIDREDLHALAAALDDVVDYAEECADVLGLYRIEAPMEQAVELTGVLRDAGRELALALSGLDDLAGIAGHLQAVDRLEDEGDRISRQALASLFEGGIDPMVVIRWKDVFERLEQAIDACEHVAHVLEGIQLKQA
ncbi:MAG: DUF47 domain-containing protein [Thermoleophilaceae bacterium]